MSHIHTSRITEEEHSLIAESGDSARVRLINTRRGTWIDESLLPAARRECLQILQIASQVVSEGIAKRVRNVFWTECGGRSITKRSVRS